MQLGRRGLVIVLLWMVGGGPAELRGAAADLRVMSFNIRNSVAQDGENAWPLRREMLVRTIEGFGPDLLGLQECQPDQRDFLRDALGERYDLVGIPRDDGKTRGEICAVLFSRDRFIKVREGHFWLSETPEVPGSRSWDAAITRIVTWVELKDRRAPGEASVVVFNTHFDHKGPQSRRESARLLRQRIIDVSGEGPVIVLGDFNAAQASAPHRTLLEGGRLADTFEDVHKTPATTQAFTFHGFTGRNERSNRIDWVLRSPHFETREAAIDRFNERGRYPSDHFPVTAVLRWKQQN